MPTTVRPTPDVAVARPTVHLLGIRHHGPGSARAVLEALDALAPVIVLVEAPADAGAALSWIGHPALVPPVALLGYVTDQPHRAVFSPFTSFSPEWQAVAWANRRGVEIRAIDVPHAVTLAGTDGSDGPGGGLDPRPPSGRVATIDPLGMLAAAAGDPDPERWWEDVVEHRGDGLATFGAVAEAMTAVREGVVTSPSDRLREAHMRRALRRAVRDLGGTGGAVAVICGAWHVPALRLDTESGRIGSPITTTASADAAVLRSAPKGPTGSKVAVSWVPWSHRRLASGDYGARVRSPGWYDHVFRSPGAESVPGFVVEAARVLRAAGLSASPDHLVATTRLADALGTLRGRPRPGLDEVLDAADAVMGGLHLLRDRVVVGDAVGSVPDDAPQVPLARDLAAKQRRLRLAVTADATLVELDLRTPTGLARSRLLHRLDAMGLAWGAVEAGRGSSGSFRESWRLRWDPEFAVRLVELSGYGTTVERAATARLVERSRGATGLGELARLVDAALLADLPDAVAPVVATLAARATDDPDLGGLMDALGPLARSMRYGDVRSTDAAALRQVFDGLVVRVLAGIVAACRSLGDDAAAVMVERLSATQAALALVDHPARHRDLPATWWRLAEAPVHGAVQGRATRLLHDAGAGDAGAGVDVAGRVARRFGRALTPGTPPAVGARFVEGFLAGSGTVLVHDLELRDLLDRWLASLTPDAFIGVVPLLRRTFGGFEPGERRQLGLLLAGDVPASSLAGAAFGDGVDERRARLVLATARTMLGLPEDGQP